MQANHVENIVYIFFMLHVTTCFQAAGDLPKMFCNVTFLQMF